MSIIPSLSVCVCGIRESPSLVPVNGKPQSDRRSVIAMKYSAAVVGQLWLMCGCREDVLLGSGRSGGCHLGLRSLEIRIHNKRLVEGYGEKERKRVV